jgi:hypothetical protein
LGRRPSAAARAAESRAIQSPSQFALGAASGGRSGPALVQPLITRKEALKTAETSNIRREQLLNLAADPAEYAAADLFKEFPPIATSYEYEITEHQKPQTCTSYADHERTIN